MENICLYSYTCALCVLIFLVAWDKSVTVGLLQASASIFYCKIDITAVQKCIYIAYCICSIIFSIDCCANNFTLQRKYRVVKTVLWIQIPNTLNLDPDPEFWLNLDQDPGPDPDPDPGLCYKFWKRKLKIILEKSNFCF